MPKKDGRNPVEQRAIENFEKIAKEGRKYGVALLIVSQRPSDVSSTILSQCNNIVTLRLANGDDQATVKRLMPESLEGLMDTLLHSGHRGSFGSWGRRFAPEQNSDLSPDREASQWHD